MRLERPNAPFKLLPLSLEVSGVLLLVVEDMASGASRDSIEPF